MRGFAITARLLAGPFQACTDFVALGNEAAMIGLETLQAGKRLVQAAARGADVGVMLLKLGVQLLEFAVDLGGAAAQLFLAFAARVQHGAGIGILDRKSTRLNSSHVKISYAVFC